jgi:hypothetical protein
VLSGTDSKHNYCIKSRFQEQVEQQVTEQMANVAIEEPTDNWGQADNSQTDWSQQSESQTNWSQQTESHLEWNSTASNQNECKSTFKWQN